MAERVRNNRRGGHNAVRDDFDAAADNFVDVPLKGNLDIPSFDPETFTFVRYLVIVKVLFATFMESDNRTPCSFQSVRKNSLQLLSIFVIKFMNVLASAVEKHGDRFTWLKSTHASWLSLIESAAADNRSVTSAEIEAWFASQSTNFGPQETFDGFLARVQRTIFQTLSEYLDLFRLYSDRIIRVLKVPENLVCGIFVRNCPNISVKTDLIRRFIEEPEIKLAKLMEAVTQFINSGVNKVDDTTVKTINSVPTPDNGTAKSSSKKNNGNRGSVPDKSSNSSPSDERKCAVCKQRGHLCETERGYFCPKLLKLISEGKFNFSKSRFNHSIESIDPSTGLSRVASGSATASGQKESIPKKFQPGKQ